MDRSTLTLGSLSRVDLREAWASEAGDFTPWLARADNLRLLGDTIGFDLELEAQERSVGPFRADILCRDVATGSWVLIENQLERTDHIHLGQLLTYAAGLKAVTIVWIANPFTDEHRAALDWLNEITDHRFNFFGLEVELWRIGDSPPAPKFNVISKPNEWSRRVTEGSDDLTEGKSLQLSFWTGFRAFVEAQGSPITPTKPLPQNWMRISIGRSDFKLVAVVSLWSSEAESYDENEIRAEFVVKGKFSKEHFARIKEDREAIEERLGYALTWDSRPEVIQSKAFVRRAANLGDEEGWPELFEWLLARLEDFHGVFAPRVRSLPQSYEVEERESAATEAGRE